MKTVSLIQGTPEWMAHRAQHFNASDAPAMMGCSPHMTRSELLHMKKTGIAPEVDPATQRRFDDGHRFEALARPLAEKIIGEELYAVTGTNGELSASFDGLTLLEDTAFEHKSLNESLRYTPWDEGNGYHLPPHYQVQMEHQLMVSGAERVLFMATKWGSADELKEERHCWYASDPALRAKILAGWKQFAADLVNFTPTEVVAAPVGKAPETLPALHIVLKGEVSASNLDEFKEVALAAIRSVNRDLQTDQDFADSAKARKWCEDIESKVAAAKQHALSQTETIDALFRALDEISDEACKVRKELKKLEEARTLGINGEVVADGVKQFADHMRALNAAMPAPYMPPIQADFGGAIKNLRTVASKKNAVATELARAKIAANEVSTRIQGNLRTLAEKPAMALLFPDVAQIVLKQPDDLQALVANRINAHELAEQKKQDELREKIRKEEADRLQREAKKKLDDEAEANRKAQEAIKTASTPAPVPAQVMADHGLPTHPMFTDDQNVEITSAPAASVTARLPGCPLVFTPSKDFGVVAVDAKHQTDETPTMNLGEICTRLGFTVTAGFLAELGFTATVERGARLYRSSDFPRICAAIVDHVDAVRLGVAA